MAVERVAIRIPGKLKEQLTAQVERDGYGPRGKSRWVREALHVMLKHDPNMEYVGQGDSLDGRQDVRELITLPPSSLLLLRDKSLELRLAAPTLEGPRSLLLRSAIRYRLQNPQSFPAKRSSR